MIGDEAKRAQEKRDILEYFAKGLLAASAGPFPGYMGKPRHLSTVEPEFNLLLLQSVQAFNNGVMLGMYLIQGNPPAPIRIVDGRVRSCS